MLKLFSLFRRKKSVEVNNDTRGKDIFVTICPRSGSIYFSKKAYEIANPKKYKNFRFWLSNYSTDCNTATVQFSSIEDRSTFKSYPKDERSFHIEDMLRAVGVDMDLKSVRLPADIKKGILSFDFSKILKPSFFNSKGSTVRSNNH